MVMTSTGGCSLPRWHIALDTKHASAQYISTLPPFFQPAINLKK